MLRTVWVGCVLLGDINIHHRKWLKYSNRNSLEGQEFCAVCKELGMTQLVHEPTRGDHLLDVVLSSFFGLKTGVLPMIADHKPVTATLKLSVPSHVVACSKVWRYGQADWERLHDSLAHTCWDHIADQSTTAAAKWITNTILRSASSCTPLSTLSAKKSSHPWLNDRTIALVDAKRTAEGTPLEKGATLACSAGLAAAYHDYTARTAQKIRRIKTSSKLWRQMAKEIMKHEAQVSSFPALKSNDGEWVLDAQGKANLFAVTFAEKCKLPRLSYNSYTVCTKCHELQTSVVCPSVEQCMAVLTSLRDDSSTGPDLLPARILKRCAEQLAKHLQSLLQRMLETKSWPESCREHWVVPIYKKKAVFAASNHRGIHLTAQMSKVVERLLLPLIEPHISRTVAFGPNQFAYTKCRGDALAYLTMSWLLALNCCKKVAVYCSDVSGAFDRVRAERLLEKLRCKRVHPMMVALTESWLQQRTAHVVVEDQFSDKKVLKNMVFQGTVLGPTCSMNTQGVPSTRPVLRKLSTRTI